MIQMLGLIKIKTFFLQRVIKVKVKTKNLINGGKNGIGNLMKFSIKFKKVKFRNQDKIMKKLKQMRCRDFSKIQKSRNMNLKMQKKNYKQKNLEDRKNNQKKKMK